MASLPCYSPKNVNMQRYFYTIDPVVIISQPNQTKTKSKPNRGKGVFDRSIRGLQKLNEIGYGQPGR